MYRKLKKILKEKGQKNEHNQYSIMLPNNDQRIIYDKDLNVLVLHEHESTNVKISKGVEDLPYEEQYEIFKELGIEPKNFYDKLQIYINAEGKISKDGLYKGLNLTTPIQFHDKTLNCEKSAIGIVFIIDTDQVNIAATEILKQSNVKGSVELEYYHWLQVPEKVRNEIQNQFRLKETSWEKHINSQLTINRERIKDLVKERGIQKKEGLYLQLPKRFGYSDSPFTVNDGKWVPTHSIVGIILTETDLLLECNYTLDCYGTLDNELHYLKLEEIENLPWLGYLVWILENK